MDNEEFGMTIPYVVHESEVARLERINKRFFTLIVTLVLLLFATNIGWIVYEAQFEDEVVTVESAAEGNGTAIANASGEVTMYGTSESNGTAKNP